MATKAKEKWYLSKKPGYTISLPDGMEYVDVSGPVSRKRTTVKFPARGGKLFKTSDPVIQDILEKHPAYKRNTIQRVPTPEEIKQAEELKKQMAQLKFYQDAVARGANFPFKDMSDSELRKVAQEIGAETADEKGTKLTKAAIVKNVEALVMGEAELPEPADIPEM